jgi:hypothetical protein
MTNQDSPWKEMLEQNLGEAVEFFFPAIHAEIDWKSDYEILRQELPALAPPGEKRIADLVAKATSTHGETRYLHGEVQGDKEDDFAHRVHVYNRRIADKFDLPVGSFVLLTDDDPAWQPDRYEAVLYGKKQTLEFHARKVIEWEGREEELKAHPNPVGLFVLAQLASMRTKKDDEARAEAKFEMILLIHERFDTETERRRWTRYLDWLLALPHEYDLRVWDRVLERQGKNMPYVTFLERHAKEQWEKLCQTRGRIEGRLEAIEVALQIRFPDSAVALMAQARQVGDLDKLHELLEAAKSSDLATIQARIAAVLPASN